MKDYRFILASASPRRKELLTTMGIDFSVRIPDIIEVPKKHESPEEYVARNAREKVACVLASLKKDPPAATKYPPVLIILAADTIVVHKNKILEKPSSVQHAVAMLKGIVGKKHNVFTGFAILKQTPNAERPRLSTKVVESSVWLRKMTEKEVWGYVKTGEPMDKAGSYAIQGLGSTLVRKIEGSYTNVVGLPVFEVFTVLDKMGLKFF